MKVMAPIPLTDHHIKGKSIKGPKMSCLIHPFDWVLVSNPTTGAAKGTRDHVHNSLPLTETCIKERSTIAAKKFSLAAATTARVFTTYSAPTIYHYTIRAPAPFIFYCLYFVMSWSCQSIQFSNGLYRCFDICAYTSKSCYIHIHQLRCTRS